ncbi:MAG: hypothetical protein HYY06_03225 [Deltaproteobacteria bacterium]|nr:hypothetical protein [Deltaproteobacteria bacterium]
MILNGLDGALTDLGKKALGDISRFSMIPETRWSRPPGPRVSSVMIAYPTGELDTDDAAW